MTICEAYAGCLGVPPKGIEADLDVQHAACSSAVSRPSSCVTKMRVWCGSCGELSKWWVYVHVGDLWQNGGSRFPFRLQYCEFSSRRCESTSDGYYRWLGTGLLRPNDSGGWKDSRTGDEAAI
jgi:hypothetical protein